MNKLLHIQLTLKKQTCRLGDVLNLLKLHIIQRSQSFFKQDGHDLHRRTNNSVSGNFTRSIVSDDENAIQLSYCLSLSSNDGIGIGNFVTIL
jgi:hypothetical protein